MKPHTMDTAQAYLRAVGYAVDCYPKRTALGYWPCAKLGDGREMVYPEPERWDKLVERVMREEWVR